MILGIESYPLFDILANFLTKGDIIVYSFSVSIMNFMALRANFIRQWSTLCFKNLMQLCDQITRIPVFLKSFIWGKLLHLNYSPKFCTIFYTPF